MNKLFKFLILVISLVFIFSCGIEKFYYLPQVPVGNITTTLNTNAVINIPDVLSSSEYDEYAPGYSFYYRIYISHLDISSQILPDEMTTINSTLRSDYNFFEPYTDSTNQTSVLNANSFRNRNYHELELYGININSVITRAGGTFTFNFPIIPGDSPFLEPSGYFLFRNSGTGNNNGILFELDPGPFFFYTEDLVEGTDTTNNINNDVILRSDRQSGFAYISIYIVAVGANPNNFTRIFSKPTHIGVFKLPGVP